MTEHTPGPWVVRSGHLMGLTVTIMRDLKLWNGVEADIRLIAAAPELLEALRSCESWIDRWTAHIGNCKGGNECSCGRSAVLHEALDAITKATPT